MDYIEMKKQMIQFCILGNTFSFSVGKFDFPPVGFLLVDSWFVFTEVKVEMILNKCPTYNNQNLS